MDLLQIWKTDILTELSSGDFTITKVIMTQRKNITSFTNTKITTPSIDAICARTGRNFLVDVLERSSSNKIILQFAEYTSDKFVSLPTERLYRCIISEYTPSVWELKSPVEPDSIDIDRIVGFLKAARIFSMMNIDDAPTQVHNLS